MSAPVPSQLFPLVRAFLATNGLTSTVKAFDKELGNSKVAAQPTDGDLFEICRSYLLAQKPEKEGAKRKAAEEEEEETPKPKKAKVDKEEKSGKKEKKEKKEEEEDSDSDSDSDSSDSSDSDSGSSDSDSDSDSGSSDSDSSSSNSDSDSSSNSSSGSDSDSESSSSEDSDSPSDEKSKKKKGKGKQNGKEANGRKGGREISTPSTPSPASPIANGSHTPAPVPAEADPTSPVTPASQRKNTPYKRVTEEDSLLLREQFSDNTFESKKGDEYGKKANDILSLCRGKSFRTEKTKKKKGTYRGGTIDLNVNSVKFFD